MPFVRSARREAGQASAEAIGLTVLVALLLAALSGLLPAVISLSERPPAVIERLGVVVGVGSPKVHVYGSLERSRSGMRPTTNPGAHALVRRAAAPVDSGRAAARLLRRGLGHSEVPDPTFDLAMRISRLRDLVLISVERFMWFKGVGRFIGAAGIDGSFNWDDDGCSHVPDFSFRNECSHHDFSYRNAKALGVFDHDIKGAADDHLRREIAAQCAARRRISRYVCRGWSVTVWAGVRLFG